MTVKSKLSELDKIRTFMTKCLAGLNISEELYYIIELSLLEMCTNVIRYAYPKDKGDVFLRSWQEEGTIYFEIKDKGIPFDPRKTKTPDVQEIIEKEKIGGYGIFLSRKLMDGFDYKREKNQNILTMHKKINS